MKSIKLTLFSFAFTYTLSLSGMNQPICKIEINGIHEQMTCYTQTQLGKNDIICIRFANIRKTVCLQTGFGDFFQLNPIHYDILKVLYSIQEHNHNSKTPKITAGPVCASSSACSSGPSQAASPSSTGSSTYSSGSDSTASTELSTTQSSINSDVAMATALLAVLNIMTTSASTSIAK